MSAPANSTPLMKQYWDIKVLYPEPILLFRMGDFYEMFFDDAVKAAPTIGIALTSRNKKGGDETPMCGVPHHSIAGPIKKLLAAGYKVAICDQLEDPKQAKGIVKRGVTRVLTPGMVYDLDTLDGSSAHYLASFDEKAVAFLETSTGEAFWIPVAGRREALRFLDVLPVAELVLTKTVAETLKNPRWPVSIHETALKTDALMPSGAPEACGRLIDYVRTLAGGELLKILQPFGERQWESRLHLSSTVIRHLEVFQTYKGEGPGSLIHAIDRTRSSAGCRLLRQWLAFPLTDPMQISARWDAIEAWRQRPHELKRVREILGTMGDIERRLGKIPLPTCNGRDLLALADSVIAGLAALKSAGHTWPHGQELEMLATGVQNTLVEDPPLSTKQGYLIRRGVSSELDELIDLSTNAQGLLARMEAEEREKTGISTLKIRYNSVFGYYIEITNSQKDKAPAHYQRKQTLANAERFCTDALVELERKVLSAQTRRSEMESEIFESLRRGLLTAGPRLLDLARACAELDVLTALSWLSMERGYVRPMISGDGHLALKASRHPVVEQTVGKDFVPNDAILDARHCLLLTGPNMAGKSTLMRQVALTALLAQAGSYVPATEAIVPIFDAIYTRIGASDQLSEGLSTFMVEMTETAAMLEAATERSLVILDEVGRGTSTFDGMCLAQSILEHLLSDVRCLTLFATHYHELTQLDRLWPQVKNAHMTVSDRGGEIRFLHTLVAGPAMKSYGVQVAELAGLPSDVTKRAKQLLKEIESSSRGSQTTQMSLMDMTASVPAEDSREDAQKRERVEAFLREVRELAIPSLTPLEALNRLARWQESCRDLS